MTEMALGSRARESMGAQDNELTFRGLARKLETLRRENAELRHKMATLEGSTTDRNEMAAVAATLLSPRQASGVGDRTR
jgi:hypothetical protein